MPELEKSPQTFLKRHAVVIVYIWIYAGWFGCVLLGKYGFNALSLVIPLIGCLIFGSLFKPSIEEWLKALAFAILGMTVDGFASRFGLLRFLPSDHQVMPELVLIPVWLVSLWLLFMPALFMLKKLFGHRWRLAALAGAIAGPLSYKSGESFNVLYLNGWSALAVYALFWAIYLPLALTCINAPTEPRT